jgi:hypothetical protein
METILGATIHSETARLFLLDCLSDSKWSIKDLVRNCLAALILDMNSVLYVRRFDRMSLYWSDAV